MKKTPDDPLTKLSWPAAWGGLAGFLLIASAIALSTNHLVAFFSIEGVMIVFGGVMAVAFMSFGVKDVNAALHAIHTMFRESPATDDEIRHDVVDILNWARIIKDKGTLGLERSINQTSNADPFVAFGLTLVVSDYAPEEIHAMMETAADARYERDSGPVQVLHAMASHAPAFGMVGTLIGMVTMLYNLSGNPTGIGPALAVSFLSTFYGVVSARMIYMPAAARLTLKLDSQRFRNLLLTEGMVLLASKKSSVYVQDRLNSFLSPEMRNGLVDILHERDLKNMKKAASA